MSTYEGKTVSIIWTDPARLDGWTDKEDALALTPAICTLQGQCVKHVKGSHMVIAFSSSSIVDDEGPENGCVLTPIAIPEGAIQKVKVLQAHT